MKKNKNFEDYSQIVSKHQLTEINGGFIPLWVIGYKLTEWSVTLQEKIDDWIQSKL